MLPLERRIKIKLKEVEHSSDKRDIICNYILPYFVHVLSVPSIHRPVVGLGDVHCSFPVAVLSCT